MSRSRRTVPLPGDWRTTRKRVLRRDRGICYVCGREGANEVDHIIPACDGGSDNESNLAAIHGYPCHAQKTARESQRHQRPGRSRPPAEHPGIVKPPATRLREPERHPGLINN